MGERATLAAKAVLIYAVLANGVVGLWATISPRGFYDDFPGFGQVWVAVDGPYNAHLLRDVGSWALALTVLCVAALWTLDRRLVITAGVALTIQAVLHAQYHLTSDNPFDTTGELVQSSGGIVLLALLGAWLTLAAYRSPAPAPAPAPARH